MNFRKEIMNMTLLHCCRCQSYVVCVLSEMIISRKRNSKIETRFRLSKNVLYKIWKKNFYLNHHELQYQKFVHIFFAMNLELIFSVMISLHIKYGMCVHQRTQASTIIKYVFYLKKILRLSNSYYLTKKKIDKIVIFQFLMSL